jgi:hypothetical protein
MRLIASGKAVGQIASVLSLSDKTRLARKLVRCSSGDTSPLEFLSFLGLSGSW